MFRVTRYPMIFKTKSGRVGYRKKYRVAGRVRVPAGHWLKVNFLRPMVLAVVNGKEWPGRRGTGGDTPMMTRIFPRHEEAAEDTDKM